MRINQLNLKYNFLTIIALVLIAQLSCAAQKKISESNYNMQLSLPGVIKIDSNLFCDQTEITNLNWREYMFWNERIFGKNSSEYLSTLPDTLVWVKNFDCLESYVDYYLRHPAYNKFPVVGISQQQAMAYSEWRSDRVFENILIMLKKIKWDSVQNPNTYFSTERYYNDSLKNIETGKKIKFYPLYRLPTLDERSSLIAFMDSIYIQLSSNCKSKKCDDCLFQHINNQLEITPCDSSVYKTSPTIQIYGKCESRKFWQFSLFNIKGNVNEWTAMDGIAAGGSWLDKRKQIMLVDTLRISEPNAGIGFRNVCEWKIWQK